MKNKEIVNSNSAYKSIKLILLKARGKSFRAIDNIIVKAYWNVGKIIVEEEQKGADRAEYGKRIIESFSKKLTKDFGKGFSPTNLKYFRLFYLTFPKGHALRDELSWTHYRLILKIENIESRNFYITECLESRWSTRELERQINSLFFERISLSKNKDEIKKLSQHGQILDKTSDLVKDPYVLEFLGLEDKTDFVEKELEQYLIDNLEKFILELGKGFSFVARQKRITLDGDHFYIDLVFYNRFTKSFVLLDLKVGKLTHQDIGQMQMYLHYYQRTQKIKGENDPIGIILCTNKNDAVVEFTLSKDEKNIFASKYLLHLPTKQELKAEIIREREIFEREKKLNIWNTDDTGKN